MTTRRKYFYALEDDWPPVLTAVEDALDVEYVQERASDDWKFPRFPSWTSLQLSKQPDDLIQKRYMISSPPGAAFREEEWLQRDRDAADPNSRRRPQIMDPPGAVLFDPRGFDPVVSKDIGTPFIDEGWLATGHYDVPGSKAIFDTLVKAMQKRFANYTGTLFGYCAYHRIIEDGWKFGQGGPNDNDEKEWDLARAKLPRSWNAKS